jgi:hypothetical protein
MIHELQLNFHSRVIQGRSIDTTINSDRFEELYRKSSLEERQSLADILTRMNKEQLKIWMETHSSITIEDWGKEDLQDRARRLKIPNFSRLLKQQLIDQIIKAENEADEED